MDLNELAKQKGIKIKADDQPSSDLSVHNPSRGRRRPWLGAESELEKIRATSETNAQCVLEKDSEKTDSKQEAGGQQTGSKTDSKNAANGKQTDSKQVAKGDKRIVNGQQTGSQTDSKNSTNRKQTDSKQVAEKKSPFSLFGNEKAFLQLVFKECSVSGSLVTPEMTLNRIAESLKCSTGTAKNIIFRVVEKKIVRRAESKTGRGGWIKFSISKELYQELKIRQDFGPQPSENGETDSKRVAKRIAEQIASCSSSSRDLIIKEPTTEQKVSLQITDQIDLSMALSFGISKSTIIRAMQLNPNLRLEDLQNLIFRFGVYASDSKNKMQSPVGFFLGLCKQLGQGMIPLEHIQTPDEKLLADLAKQSRAAAAQKQETEDALLAFEFEVWMETITLEKRNELVPESVAVRPGSYAQTMMLKKHYVENLWDVRRKELLRIARDLTLPL